MTAGWVAATTRGRAMIARTLGADGAVDLAHSPDWRSARSRLSPTVYGRALPSDASRAEARTAAIGATAWQLRVLAGWLPPSGAVLARLAAAPLEIHDIERHLAGIDGADRFTPVDLGTLGTAWPRLAATTSRDEARAVLARSAWGDPGGLDRTTTALGLRVSMCRRAARLAPGAREWALGALAVLVARERLVFGRDVAPATARDVDRLVGRGWRSAGSVEAFAETLPASANWAIADLTADEMWRAEIQVAQRIAADAGPIAATGRPAPATFVAIVAVLLTDLWRVLAAVEVAGRGPDGREVLGDVA